MTKLYEGESEPVAANPVLRGVDLAMERLVQRDCFSERTMRIIDELRAEVIAASDEVPEPQGEPSDALDLDALEALAKAATPGPWMLDGMGEDEPEINYWAHRFVGTAEPNEAGSHEIIATSEDGHGPNAEYIAASDPQTVLALIAALRAAGGVR